MNIDEKRLKAASLIIALAFTLGCVGLWLSVVLMENILGSTKKGEALAPLTCFCIATKTWLLFVPVLPLVYGVLGLFRKSVSASGSILFFASLTIVFIFLFFFELISILLPWITIRTLIGG